jgi:peptidase MA superfamily protein
MTARTVARIALLAALAAACGGRPTSPSQALTQQLTTDHYVFHFSPGDSVNPAWQEAYHAWAIAQLGVTPPTIVYNKFNGRDQMASVTGHVGNAYAMPALNTVYTIWPTDNHEVVHVYTGPWGAPVALFGEGLAVAFQTDPPAGDFTPKWNATSLHVLAKQFRARGALVPIATLAVTTSFRSLDDNITYPESGSFVRFLIDTQGIDAMRRLYGSMSGDATLATVRAAFQGVYGFSLDEAESRWQQFLDGGV